MQMRSNKPCLASVKINHQVQTVWQHCFTSIIGRLLGKTSLKLSQVFFIRGHILTEINHTFITLIPKSDKAFTVNQFRPISLCNTIYKIISKILAARLIPLLHKIISPWQSAFVPSRVIQHNSIIAHEVLNTMKKKKKGLVDWWLLKLTLKRLLIHWNGHSC